MIKVLMVSLLLLGSMLPGCATTPTSQVDLELDGSSSKEAQEELSDEDKICNRALSYSEEVVEGMEEELNADSSEFKVTYSLKTCSRALDTDKGYGILIVNIKHEEVELENGAFLALENSEGVWDVVGMLSLYTLSNEAGNVQSDDEPLTL